MPHRLTVDLPDPDSTRRLGRWLGEKARKGDVVLLAGDLGAGKTSLSQGLGEGLGVTEPVTSPTFTLLNEYRGRLTFFHFDMYRLEAPEITSMGLYEYWEEPRGVVAIEWPERLGPDLTPGDHLAVTLTHRGEGRQATLDAVGRQAERWLREVEDLAARH
jgi:tRNA threonylcarbamoyladenosine biosynthesis protein TsaE